MNAEDIHITDIGRILLGEAPPSFLMEVIIRITVIYLLLMVSMRLLGRRMASMLSIQELSALVALAAATGIPMQAPDKGLLPAIGVAAVIVAIQRSISYWGFKNKKAELLLEGDVVTLVSDGVMDLKAMQKARITREALFAQVRSESIDSFGKIQRLYLEAGGSFTFYLAPEPKPGLSSLPHSDAEFIREQKTAEGISACGSCGEILSDHQKPSGPCPRCRHSEWTEAVL
jgi:uncharacterized membrane protein YcaP (DUF421 family)